MKNLLLSLCISALAINAFAADPLPLSESQIEKLRAYLPTEEEGTPLIWKGDPLSITLAMHSEKRIVFPEPIEANLNGRVNSDQLRIINNDQSLYLTALKPFDTARMYVTLKSSNKIILLDVSISAQGTNSMRTVKLASMQKDTGTLHAKPITSAVIENTSAQEDSFVGSANTYVHAIRFAWQQLYAPTVC
jgi:hypothetical protein